MFIVIYFLLYILLYIFAYNKFHRKLNVVSIFSAIWFIFGALSCLGLYGLRKPSFMVHFYVCIFVMCVDAMFFLFATKRSVTLGNIVNSVAISGKRVRIIQIVTIVLMLPLVVRTVGLYLMSNEVAYIRQMYYSGTTFSSMYQDLLFRIVPMGCLNALIIYYTLYSFETKKYQYLIYGMLNAIFVTLINGGRYVLILFLYSVVLLWVSGKIRIRNSQFVKRYKKRIRNIGIVVVAILCITTFIRGQAVLKNIYIYFSGSLSFFDYILENPSKFALDRPLYGYFTFGAILEPIILILKVLGLTTVKVPSYEFNIYCQSFYDIGTTGNRVLFNANTSVLYYFLRDFGTIGIIIGAIFIGAITVKAYNKWQKGSRFWGLCFIYLANVLFNSLMTYQFFGPTPFFIMLTFWFLTQKKIVLKKHNTGCK